MVVINKSIRNAVLPFVAISSLIALGSCKEEEVAPTAKFSDDLLIGDWQVTEIDGSSYEEEGYQILFKFEANKDFSQCVSETYSYGGSSYTYTECTDYELKWKWQDASNSTIVIFEANEGELTADVVVLDDTNMELNITNEGDTSNAKFIKVN